MIESEFSKFLILFNTSLLDLDRRFCHLSDIESTRDSFCFRSAIFDYSSRKIHIQNLSQLLNCVSFYSLEDLSKSESGDEQWQMVNGKVLRSENRNRFSTDELPSTSVGEGIRQ